jgi:hypothetical protein
MALFSYPVGETLVARVGEDNDKAVRISRQHILNEISPEHTVD